MAKKSQQTASAASSNAGSRDGQSTLMKVTTEEKEAILERMRVSKGEGQSFNAFFEDLVVELPQLKATTIYPWWLGIVVDGSASANGTATVSERLAALLRKEGLLEVRVKGLQKQLDAVRVETAELWARRGETQPESSSAS